MSPHPRRIRSWLGDITYLAIAGQWRLLAVILDQYSRRVLAWTLARRRDAQLTRTVLDAAVRRRQPNAGLIFHSDRGSEYSAAAFRDRLVHLGVRQSSAVTGPGENAHMESFFHSLKAEVVHGAHFESELALRHAIRCYMRYYNYDRLHSALGYRTPVDYESPIA